MHLNQDLDGEKVAREVASRQRALDILKESERRNSNMHYVQLIICGVILACISSQTGQHFVFVETIISGIGFFLALGSYQECQRIRRRLDAAIFLSEKTNW